MVRTRYKQERPELVRNSGTGNGSKEAIHSGKVTETFIKLSEDYKLN